MTDHIAMDTLLAGSIQLLPGDKLDLTELRAHCGWTDRLVDSLERSKRIGPLTQENFSMAKVRRVQGSPWPPAGFTQAFLEESGLVERGERPDVAPKPKAAAPAQEAKALTHVVLTEEKIQVGEHFLQPMKRGNFTFYDAADREGRLLRSTSFRSIESGTRFLTDLSTAAASAGTSDQDSVENAHGDQLRPGADGSEG